MKNANHQITINHDLNEYAFLITLVHEVAHLCNWDKHKNNVKPHGEEWKKEFKILMSPLLREEIFKPDVIQALRDYMNNPAATTCSDLSLSRVLKKYDHPKGLVLLETVEDNTIFKIQTGRYFVKGERIRKRFQCRELKTNKVYLFNPLSEVILINNSII